MRAYGALSPTDQIPLPPDTMANYVLAAGTAQAADWPTDAHLVRFRGATTAGGVYAFAVNMASTQAVWPAATVTPTTNTTGLNTIVPAGDELVYQRHPGSTGFSLIGGSSGIVSVEFWKK